MELRPKEGALSHLQGPLGSHKSCPGGRVGVLVWELDSGAVAGISQLHLLGTMVVEFGGTGMGSLPGADSGLTGPT